MVEKASAHHLANVFLHLLRFVEASLASRLGISLEEFLSSILGSSSMESALGHHKRITSCLMLCADFGDVETIKKLLVWPIDIDLSDDLGGSALHHAIASDELETVEYLIRKGAAVSPDRYSRWPTTIALITQASQEVLDAITAYEAENTDRDPKSGQRKRDRFNTFVESLAAFEARNEGTGSPSRQRNVQSLTEPSPQMPSSVVTDIGNEQKGGWTKN